MAITWTIETIPLNIASKEASIRAVRADSADPGNDKTYTVPLAPIGTNGEKLAVANELWNKHLAATTKATVVATFVDQFNTDLKSNLEGRE